MSLTVIDIERRKKWRIGLLYAVLLAVYISIALAVYAGLVILLFPFAFTRSDSLVFSWSHIGVIIAGTIAISALHFWFSASTVIRSLVRTLGAVPPDPEDGIHRRFLNVMDEVRIMAGRRKMTCLVIPSLSMNALAASDLKGEAVIAITEGLLSRLSRPQLEAVVAHEAYHVLSGDCVESTLATSLFGMYASFFERLESWAEEDSRPNFHPAFLSLKVLLGLSNLLAMIISREREYRADAAAVRMTRNPVAMAEALDIVSRNWTGSGMISNGLEMLCIASPEPDASDDSDSWAAGLLSTHPPMRKRIRMILKYAHSTIDAFEMKQKEKAIRSARGVLTAGGVTYFALDSKQRWQGPFSVAELCALSWINPRTWISGGESQHLSHASEIEAVSTALSMRIANTSPSYVCPDCRQALWKIDYENTQVYECSTCGGTLVDSDKIPRIIARREKDCSERVKALATAVVRDNQRAMTIRHLKNKGKRQMTGHTCSKCRNTMFRTFYSGAYLIEIDRCGICGLTWFDADELEMLQCLIENKITGTIGTGTETS
jgi:heat shock protein HtpX